MVLEFHNQVAGINYTKKKYDLRLFVRDLRQHSLSYEILYTIKVKRRICSVNISIIIIIMRCSSLESLVLKNIYPTILS